ncbi:hypothetical protein D3C81_1074970 [compost metagenome]
MHRGLAIGPGRDRLAERGGPGLRLQDGGIAIRRQRVPAGGGGGDACRGAEEALAQEVATRRVQAVPADVLLQRCADEVLGRGHDAPGPVPFLQCRLLRQLASVGPRRLLFAPLRARATAIDGPEEPDRAQPAARRLRAGAASGCTMKRSTAPEGKALSSSRLATCTHTVRHSSITLSSAIA